MKELLMINPFKLIRIMKDLLLKDQDSTLSEMLTVKSETSIFKEPFREVSNINQLFKIVKLRA